MQEGLSNDYHCHFGMDNELLGIIVLIHCHIYTLLLIQVILFNVNGGTEGKRACCW